MHQSQAVCACRFVSNKTKAFDKGGKGGKLTGNSHVLQQAKKLRRENRLLQVLRSDSRAWALLLIYAKPFVKG